MTRRMRQRVARAIAWASCLAFAGFPWAPYPAAAAGRGRDGLGERTRGQIARERAARAARELSEPAAGAHLLGIREKASRVELRDGPVDVLLPDASGEALTMLAWERRPLETEWIEQIDVRSSSRDETVMLPVSEKELLPRISCPPEMKLLYKADSWDAFWGHVKQDERMPNMSEVVLRGTATKQDGLEELKKYRVKVWLNGPCTETYSMGWGKPKDRPYVRQVITQTPFVSRKWQFKATRYADFPVSKTLRGYKLLHFDKGLADAQNARLTESALRDEQATDCESVAVAPVQRRVEASFPAAKGQPAIQRIEAQKSIRTAQLVDYRYLTAVASTRRRVIEPVSKDVYVEVKHDNIHDDRIVVTARDEKAWWGGTEHKVESSVENVIVSEGGIEKQPIKTVEFALREETEGRQAFPLRKQELRFQDGVAEYDKLTPATFYEQPGPDGRVPESWGAPGGITFVLPDGTRHDKDSTKAWAYASRNAIPKPCEAASEPSTTAGRPVAGPGAGAGSGTGAAGPGDPGKKGGAQASGPETGGQMAKRRILSMADAPADFQIGDPVLSGDVSVGGAARHASVAEQRRLLGAQNTRSEGARGQGRRDLLDDLFARAELGELRLVDERRREVFRGVIRGNALMLQAQRGGQAVTLARGSRHARGADGRTAIEIVSAREGQIEGTFSTPAGTWSRLYY